MTISAVVPDIAFAGSSGSGTMGPFSLVKNGTPIVFYNNSEVVVLRYDTVTDTAPVLLVEGTDYTLTGGPSSGSITLTSPQTGLLTAERLYVTTLSALAQNLDLVNGGNFSSSNLERRLDIIFQVLQQHAREIKSTIRFAMFDTDEIPKTTPLAAVIDKLPYVTGTAANPLVDFLDASALGDLVELTDADKANLSVVAADLSGADTIGAVATVAAEVATLAPRAADIETVATAIDNGTLDDLLDDQVGAVATYTALAGIAADVRFDGMIVYVAGRASANDGAEGHFRWVTGNQSSSVTADPRQAIWVAPTDASTGASGAWKRVFDATDWLPLKWWNPTADATWNTDGGTDDFLALYYAINSGYKIDGQGLTCAFVSRAFSQQTAASPTAPTVENGLRCTQANLYLRNLRLVIRTPHYWGCRGLIGNDFTGVVSLDNVDVSYPGNGYISVVDVENSDTPDDGASNYQNTACLWIEASDTDSEVSISNCEVTGSFIGTGIRVINFQRSARVFANYVHDIEYDFITPGNLDPANDRINGISIEQCKNVFSYENRVSQLGGYYHASATDYTSHRYTIGHAFGGCEYIETYKNKIEYVHQAFDYTGSAGNRYISHHDNTTYRCEVWTAKFANSAQHVDCYGNTSVECLQGMVISGATSVSTFYSSYAKFHDNRLIQVGNFTSGRATEAGFTKTGVTEYGTSTITGIWIAVGSQDTYHPFGVDVHDNVIIGDTGGNMAYGVQDTTTVDAVNQVLPNRAENNTILNADTANYKGPLSRDLSVGRTGNQAIAANSNTDILFNNGEFDPSGSYDSSTGVYTAKWDMFVEVEAGYGLEDTAIASAIFFCTLNRDTGSGYAKINGAESRGVPNATNNTTLKVSWSGWLNAGDKLKVVAYQNNGTSTGLNIREDPMTFFRIREKPSVPDAANWVA